MAGVGVGVEVGVEAKVLLMVEVVGRPAYEHLKYSWVIKSVSIYSIRYRIFGFFVSSSRIFGKHYSIIQSVFGAIYSKLDAKS